MPHKAEAERLEALRRLDVVGSAKIEALDRITRMAAKLFDVPVALVTLIEAEKQWFKSRIGTDVEGSLRKDAFCIHAMGGQGVFMVPDAEKDDRFAANPLVTGDMGIRFYAGAPLTTRDGYNIGTMCVIDRKPRSLNSEEQAVLQDLAQLVMSQIELRHAIGRVDAFSGLPNRNQLYEDMVDDAEGNEGDPASLMVIELLAAAQIDDVLRALGSTHGDALIRSSAWMLREALGSSVKLYHIDTARYACLIEAEDSMAASLIEQVRQAFETPVFCDNVPITIHPAIGLSHFRRNEMDGPDVVRTAIAAAVDARSMSRLWAGYDQDADQAHRRSFRLLSDMRQAIDADDQLRLVYQPKINLANGNVESAEALLRWVHPGLGNVPPGEFIPLVEQTALARPVTEYVINAAIRQSAEWAKQGLDIRVAVNVSARNMEENDFAKRLEIALRHYKVEASCIELEFTESALMKNGADILQQLRAVQGLGIDIAIDDFGTGYSNHAYLQHLPAKTVKLDQSLIRSLETSKRDRTIVQSTMDMLHDLGYRVVAEGVETAVIYDMLAGWGCDEIQGYHIARPMEALDFALWVTSRSARQAAAH